MAKIPIEIDVVDDKAIQSMDSFGGSLGSVVGGLRKMTLAAKAFIATPIGAIIAAITLAIGALTSFFKRSEEGQNALNRVVRIFGSILDNILDVVDKVGKAIFEFVTNPLEGIEKLGNSIITFLQNPIQGVTDLINGAKEAAIAFVEEVKEDIETSKILADTEADLNKLQRQFTVDQARRQAQIAELRLKAREDDRFNAEERKGFLEEASRLINQQLAEELKIATLRRDVLVANNKLANSTIETKQEEAEAEAKLSDLQAKRFTEQRALQREFLRINNEIRGERTKAVQEEERIIKELNKEIAESFADRAEKEAEFNRQVVLDIRKIIDVNQERADKEREQFEARQRSADAEKTARLSTVASIADATALGAKLLGEQTIAGIALGVATATADTFVAANKAMATIPPPAGQIVAGVIIAAGLANVAQIIKAGQAAGAVVGGGGSGGVGAATVATSATNFPTVSTGIAQQQSQTTFNATVSVEEINDVNNRVTIKEIFTQI